MTRPMRDDGGDLPERIIVDRHGHYWRDYGNHYSMCPVSEDNDPVNPVVAYVPETRRTFIDGLAERALTPTGDHHIVPGGYCLDCQGQHISEWDPPGSGREAGLGSIPERPAEPLPAVTVEALAEAVRRSGWVCDDDEHRSARYDKRDCGCDKLAAVIRAALAQQSTPESRDG